MTVDARSRGDLTVTRSWILQEAGAPGATCAKGREPGDCYSTRTPARPSQTVLGRTTQLARQRHSPQHHP
eukprot:2036348-Prymnesium_polylepis.1